MGRERNQPIRVDAIERYLTRIGFVKPRVLSLQPLGQDAQEGRKDYGYGRPLRVTVRSDAGERTLVLRTMSPDPFGHDRRADRADAMVLSFDTFNDLPHHIRALHLGAFDDEDEMWSVESGEFFLLTDYVEGELYAHLLAESARAAHASDSDRSRVSALAHYLATLHIQRRPAAAYARHLRDTLGSGEGIFGLCDSYPSDCSEAPPERLREIERLAVDWRWKMKAMSHRSRSTHGDFHPFNLLFRDVDDFTVLDRSRGGVGDPADDVVCLAINFLFFALDQRGAFDGAMRDLWHHFFASYLAETGDRELLSVVAPYFAWRGLVLASPLWYPNLDSAVRARLLTLVERLLAGAAFDPDRVDEVLS
ncbi:MAG: phosphotransferase [Myxococcales bacterium]|nr:phosphotransferase [Myxococcales bacterium]